MVADFIDGVVALAQVDDQVPRGRLFRLGPGAAPGGDEEDGIGLATKVVAQDVKGADRIAKGLRHLLGGKPVNEIGAERFVLPLLRGLGIEEKALDDT
jgi:hypothetical protein